MKMIKNVRTWTSLVIICSAMLTAPVYSQQHKLSDPEIASIAVTANQVDINAAELAKSKTESQDIIDFANTMINDHQAVIAQAVALVTRLKVTPKENAVSKKLMADADTTKKMLNAKSGKAFDNAYINNEVSYHKAVISTVENVLIPQTQNPELKELLQNVLPPLRTHLEHAEMLQKNYNK
jgi:putative membrane protein